MKRIAVPLVAGILALGFTPSASAATPRADRYYVVVCNGTEYESVDAHAVELGAQEAAFQPQDEVRVLLDPAGHPFCLYVDVVDG